MRDRIIQAFNQYDTDFPNNDYANWLDNGNYHWACQHNGKLYPVKKIWEYATGDETINYNTKYSKDGLEEKGFRIVEKPGWVSKS